MDSSEKKILLCNNIPAEAQEIQSFLSSWGYDAQIANPDQDLLDQIEEQAPAIILIEMQYPPAGIVCVKEIQAQPEFAHIPILFMTEDSSEETTVMVLSSGAHDLIFRPLKVAELTVRLEKILELVEARNQLHQANARLQKERNILARYFSDDFIESVMEEKISPRLGGDFVEASILFFDIRGSTTIAEIIHAEKFSEFLSRIFKDLMDIVFVFRGSVNRLEGDGMLATFGCPEQYPDYGLAAVRTALAIRDYICEYNLSPPDYLDQPLAAGIGIASGRIFAGNIGSDRKMEYTVLGDSVNTAARLQELTKKVETDILIDGATRDLLEDRLKVRQIAINQVRGKLKTLDIFAL